MSVPSIRSLAAQLNLSHATVSEALRGSPRVKEATRRRVNEEAARLGYRLDPIASKLMAQMRRSRSHSFRGVIALVIPEDDASLPPAQRGRRVFLRESAEKRAAELGFKLDSVGVGSDAWTRLPNVLHARGVVGALVLPSDECRAEHRALLGSADFPTVYLDEPEEGAEHVDAVAPDYRQALVLARNRLGSLGHRRPGLVLSGRADTAANSRWRFAWEALRLASAGAKVELAPPLTLEAPIAQGVVLERWKHDQRVDVLLATDEIPASTGLPACRLDLAVGASDTMGLDLRWHAVASRAVDVLSRRYFDQLRGERETPALLSLPALWRAAEAADRSFAETSAREDFFAGSFGGRESVRPALLHFAPAEA